MGLYCLYAVSPASGADSNYYGAEKSGSNVESDTLRVNRDKVPGSRRDHLCRAGM